MKLKPWYTVVSPRGDLKEGKPLDAAEFAVHLDKVKERQGSEVYWEPQQFFARTYLTRNLLDLSAEVVRRLSGIHTETSAVFNMSTQFGGGKTHTLTLLYHLAENGAAAHAWMGVPQIVAKAGIEQVPQARTAVFVGQRFDPRGGDDGTPLRNTPWGEIAWQLADNDGLDVVSYFDQERIAPGGDTIEKLFALVNKPILILMDEVMNYVGRYRTTGLGDQLYNFMQNLSEEARSHDNVVLAVSLPASELEMTEADIKDFKRFTKMLGRLGKDVLISAESETSEIIRRRLFEWDDRAMTSDGRIMLSKDAEATCRAYAEWTVANRNQLPSWFPVDNVDMAFERFKATYPFHPTLLSVFERKWQTVDGFQKTRGVLRLLALWIAHAYNQGYKQLKQDGDALIGVGSAPLSDPQFRTAVFNQLGDTNLEGAVTTDIGGNRDAHAPRLDSEAVDTIKKARLHQQAATSIFFESNGGQGKERKVATVPEVRLDVGRPGLDIGNVETVLETLAPPDGACYYMHNESGRYWFSTQPNLKQVLSDREAGVHEPDVEELVRGKIKHEFGNYNDITRIFFPSSSNDIPNQAVLTLVVLDPEIGMHDQGSTFAKIERWTREKGQSSRTYKSALLWAVAENNANLMDAGRKVLAWESIQNDQDVLELSAAQRKELETSLRTANGRLREAVWNAYSKVVLLGKDNELRTVDLGRQNSSSAQNLSTLIIRELRKYDDITESPSPNYLIRNWPPAFEAWSTRHVRDTFFSSPQFPRLLKGDAIRDTIARGVSAGKLAYVGKTAEGEYEPLYFNTSIAESMIEIDEDMYIIKGELAESILKKPVLTSLTVEPETVQLQRNTAHQFLVRGLDQNGQAMGVENAEWSVSSGQIDHTGLFHGASTTGTFAVTVSADGQSATATINVLAVGPEPSAVASITITPVEYKLKVGEEAWFKAEGMDEDGGVVAVGPISWQATQGEIDARGRYVAPAEVGNYEVAARYQDLSATAAVKVTAVVRKEGKLSWSGEIPSQKWMNFYMKVLTKFASGHDLNLHLDVEVSGGDGISKQQAEEMSAALRELDLNDDVELS